MKWILENKDWLFSGILVSVPLAILGWYFNKSKSKQIQKSGHSSNNIQVGGNVTITRKNDNE